ncbi:hypothetical protein OVN18_02235 [Microcella daejeonensis]|uniref:Uncharacterized protein n=1 Tax=Microcella daejeonensis TaxID=2994971 RepID=A0A9E8S8Q6_9MICO|nr:hypothetical protein [Microcella daejeonensis]WAB81860.1 hypothetical protein OVN18_02235 [Microcella daejeonensis]
MTLVNRRRHRATLALLAASALLLGACGAPGAPVESKGTASTEPSASPTPTEPEMQYRAFGDPIAAWTCDDLVPPRPGETSRTLQVQDVRDGGIEGEIRCGVDVVVGGVPEQGASYTVLVADLGDDAEPAVQNADHPFAGELLPGSDPIQRSRCGPYCVGSMAANGFVANVWSVGATSDHAVDHEDLMASLAVLLLAAERPDPLDPASAGTAPLESCDTAPAELAAAMGAALGGSTPAFSTDLDPGDGLWLDYLIDDRRGTVACAWSLASDPGSYSDSVGVKVTPGAAELIGAPGTPFVDSDDPNDGLVYSIAAGTSVITVAGVDRATAEAIAAAHG